jgi:hypothetical protein
MVIPLIKKFPADVEQGDEVALSRSSAIPPYTSSFQFCIHNTVMDLLKALLSNGSINT